MVVPCSNGHPHLRELGDWKIFPQASVENQSPVSLPRRFAPRKGRLATDFRPRPSGDFPVSAFPEVRISTLLQGNGWFPYYTREGDYPSPLWCVLKKNWKITNPSSYFLWFGQYLGILLQDSTSIFATTCHFFSYLGLKFDNLLCKLGFFHWKLNCNACFLSLDWFEVVYFRSRHEFHTSIRTYINEGNLGNYR